MSTYTRMGTIAATAMVSLEPDRSGNFVCDGTADDVEIQAAIAYVGALGGGTVHIGTCPIGVTHYEAATTITINQSNVWLEGEGWNTVIRLANGANVEMLLFTGCDSSGIRDLKLDANGANQGASWTYHTVRTSATAFLISIVNCEVTGATADAGACGIRLEQHGLYNYNLIQDCYIHANSYGICDVGGWQTMVVHNRIVSNTARGLVKEGGNALTAVANVIRANPIGVYLFYSGENTVTANIISFNDGNGVTLHQPQGGDIISSNNIMGNTHHGIEISGGNVDWAAGIIHDNVIRDNSMDNAGTYDGISITNGSYWQIIDNQIINVNNTSYTAYCIDIVAGTGNRIFGNRMLNPTVACIRDGGTDTVFPTKVVPFVDGSDPADSGFQVLTDDTHYARSFLWLPLEVQQVIRMKVYARAGAAAGVGVDMRAQFIIFGAADNEPYNTTHVGSVDNHPSTSSNFAIDDVIYWTIATAGLLAMLGGDSVEIRVQHAVADGDVETNAYFRTVAIEYV